MTFYVLIFENPLCAKQAFITSKVKTTFFNYWGSILFIEIIHRVRIHYLKRMCEASKHCWYFFVSKIADADIMHIFSCILLTFEQNCTCSRFSSAPPQILNHQYKPSLALLAIVIHLSSSSAKITHLSVINIASFWGHNNKLSKNV